MRKILGIDPGENSYGDGASNIKVTWDAVQPLQSIASGMISRSRYQRDDGSVSREDISAGLVRHEIKAR